MKKIILMLSALLSIAATSDGQEVHQYCEALHSFYIRSFKVHNAESFSHIDFGQESDTYETVSSEKEITKIVDTLKKKLSLETVEYLSGSTDFAEYRISSADRSLTVTYYSRWPINPGVVLTNFKGFEKIGEFPLVQYQQDKIQKTSRLLSSAEDEKVIGLIEYLTDDDYRIRARIRNENPKLPGYIRVLLERQLNNRAIINNTAGVGYERKGDKLSITRIDIAVISYVKKEKVKIISAQQSFLKALNDGVCERIIYKNQELRRISEQGISFGVQKIHKLEIGYMVLNRRLLPVYIFIMGPENEDYWIVPAIDD